jgi:hypothetical protein
MEVLDSRRTDFIEVLMAIFMRWKYGWLLTTVDAEKSIQKFRVDKVE